MNHLFISESELKYLERLLESRFKAVRTYRRPLVTLTDKLQKIRAVHKVNSSKFVRPITTKVQDNE